MAHLLVVEDDDALREALCDLFAEEHFCLGAATAEAAMGYLSSEVYDVVLTDISMPGMSGVELLGYIRQQQPKTPVIIISGIRDEGYAEGLIKLGAFDYLAKPFKLEEVERSVNRALDQHDQLPSAGRLPSPPEDRERLKLYVISMYALNAKSNDNAHEPGLVVAASEEEAKQKGFDQAHEKWPRSEGWIAHNVVAAKVERDLI